MDTKQNLYIFGYGGFVLTTIGGIEYVSSTICFGKDI